MTKIMQYAGAATLAGVLAISSIVPSYAEHGRNAAAAIGFGAGAVVGAAAANSNRYYSGPAYYEPSYAYSPAECRVIIRSHINRYGERVRVRTRVCD